MSLKNNLRSEDKAIYVIHQLETEFHYEGLKKYCQSINYRFEYRQFTWIWLILSGVKHLNKNGRLTKGIANYFFLLRLPFLKRKNIVLGIAPYDYRMFYFNWISKRHNLFYHTSWPYWDQTNFPEHKLHSVLKKKIIACWSNFLENNCKGIFCVSEFTHAELKKNYHITCPASVVYHSINKEIFYPPAEITINKPLKFLFAGRVVESKGIPELLTLAGELKDSGFMLGIAGAGVLLKDLAADIEQASNVTVFGKIPKTELSDLYRQFDFLLCPSKKGYGGWEELFGISIIEAMACGCIPVATNHVGPRETIVEGQDGFLIRDEELYNDMHKLVSGLMKTDDLSIVAVKRNAIGKGRQFYAEQIANRWSVIIENFI